MAPRFDRDRPYGEIIPSGGYYQDGHYFTVQGEYLRSDGPAPKPEPPAPAPAVVVPPVVEPPAPAPGGSGDTGQGAPELDLAAWAKNDSKYPHYKVVQAMKAAYPGEDFKNSRAAMVDLLVEKGVVSAEEAVRA